jgi:3'-phosphoadenosine 5'-phosphosulfate (PAPS) 3'-phosphatase
MAASLQPQTVPLHKLLSTCIDAAGRGCARIRSVQESGATGATLKIEGDAKSALTAADLAAQAAVVGALSKAWPGLTIVGEEDEAALDEDHELATPLDDSLLDWECTTSVDLAKARVFVDPLDGTREFVEGRLDAVQCLVGVAVGDQPVCGAVGLPFPADGGPPRVIYATARGSVGPSDAPRAQKRAADALLVIAGDGSDAAQAAAVEAFPGADFAVRGAAGNKLKSVAEGEADIAILHRKTSAWDTCAPSAAVLAAGGRVTDYFGAPLSYTGPVGNTLGVVASSARASKAHDAACATLRRDASALAILERYGVRGPSHAADIARDLSGAPLAVDAVAEAAGVAATSYHAPEAEAFRGALSAGCRLRIADASVFLKRVKMRELPAAVKKATAQPQKLRRDVASFRVEAAFLSSDAAQGLGAIGVQVPTVLSATVDTPTDDPLDAASLLFLRDFSPDDGYRQSNLLAGDDLRATLKALARFHAHFSEAARRPRPEEKWRCGGHWQPGYQNAEQFESGVEDAWPRLLDNFRSVLEASPATRDLGLEALGGRVQAAAVVAGREAHPFSAEDVSADVEEWRTLIHGDLKAANVLVKGDDVALLDFQYVGDGLAATDLAHFLTASVAGSELLKDGTLRDGDLVDLYLAEFATALGRAVDGDAFRRQFEVAVVDKARFVLSYLWPRIDASPAELERGANIWNRNSYNKDVKAATWLVARTAAALDKI